MCACVQLDDWVLCRIYKKPNPQQLSPFYEPSPSPSSMDAGLGLGHHHHHQHQHHHHQQQQQQEDTSSSSRMLPRNPSISDYLVDYSAVSELFDSMPPPQPETGSSAGQFFLGNTAGTGDGEASTARKRQATADSNNDGEMSSLHASKRWLGSDGSMAMMNGGFSIFGPDQPSQQDRI